MGTAHLHFILLNLQEIANYICESNWVITISTFHLVSVYQCVGDN
jgi:hypothetical protein